MVCNKALVPKIGGPKNWSMHCPGSTSALDKHQVCPALTSRPLLSCSYGVAGQHSLTKWWGCHPDRSTSGCLVFAPFLLGESSKYIKYMIMEDYRSHKGPGPYQDSTQYILETTWMCMFGQGNESHMAHDMAIL